ncbi:MAG TPA: hypothetical protein VK164_02900 [Flavobacterium sp.]|uniref:hypothetical protein n=1 Tax=Flavobacterium sp. TaxID=239 RepID=UPI002B4B196F|nr:hypothetical protein [Flavobacterium sp.]HLO72859.1 hypothetical protein [Flavobacterium sp.]
MKTKVILFIMTTLLILFYFLYNSDPNFSSKKYNQKEWLGNPNSRIHMVSDIINQKKLIGKDSVQVQNELGKSNEPPNSNEWKYLLGYKGYLSAEFYFLTIHFNNGNVDKVYVDVIKEN